MLGQHIHAPSNRVLRILNPLMYRFKGRFTFEHFKTIRGHKQSF